MRVILERGMKECVIMGEEIGFVSIQQNNQ